MVQERKEVEYRNSRDDAMGYEMMPQMRYKETTRSSGEDMIDGGGAGGVNAV